MLGAPASFQTPHQQSCLLSAMCCILASSVVASVVSFTSTSTAFRASFTCVWLFCAGPAVAVDFLQSA